MITRVSIRSCVTLLAASGLLFAQPPATPQTSQPPPGSWRRVSDPAPAPPSTQAQQAAAQSQDPTQPVERDAFGQAQKQAPPAAQLNRPAYGLPPQVTLKAGTFVTIRIDELLASNRNHPGDTFSGTLMQPIVVDGIVVARRGQTVYGRVAQAEKVKGVSHLGIELSGLTLADGSQVAVHSQLISRQGGRTPNGVQAGTIATTTAVGTVVGAAADYGSAMGAGIGAGAGAAAGIIGVLVTRNHPSVIYPETALTFQIQTPLTIATGSAPQAYRYVGPEDYDRPMMQTAPRSPQRPAYYYGGYYPYYPYYYPYFWGPGIYFGGGFFYGPRFRRFR
ncbi:MAG TPA: hypothetical protein VLY04_12470 [Bryobacteraceae bacterium]|nr:hypothetical protein [Bryobacteraceae bacterium]